MFPRRNPSVPYLRGSLGFIRVASLLLLLILPQQPRTSTASSDLSGHCGTSTASSTCQWALPDRNSERQISWGTAGPQPRALHVCGHCRPQLRTPDLSGHCRTSTASSRAQWALPDLSQTPERSQIECQKEC